MINQSEQRLYAMATVMVMAAGAQKKNKHNHIEYTVINSSHAQERPFTSEFAPLTNICIPFDIVQKLIFQFYVLHHQTHTRAHKIC